MVIWNRRGVLATDSRWIDGPAPKPLAWECPLGTAEGLTGSLPPPGGLLVSSGGKMPAADGRGAVTAYGALEFIGDDRRGR